MVIYYHYKTKACVPPTERLQREEGDASVPVHGVARPRRARVPHPHPGLPQAREGVQPSRRRPNGGSLQVWDLSCSYTSCSEAKLAVALAVNLFVLSLIYNLTNLN